MDAYTYHSLHINDGFEKRRLWHWRKAASSPFTIAAFPVAHGKAPKTLKIKDDDVANAVFPVAHGKALKTLKSGDNNGGKVRENSGGDDDKSSISAAAGSVTDDKSSIYDSKYDRYYPSTAFLVRMSANDVDDDDDSNGKHDDSESGSGGSDDAKPNGGSGSGKIGEDDANVPHILFFGDVGADSVQKTDLNR
jgi:hypothetical protein